MRFLLNISTHPGDVAIAGEHWADALSLLEQTGFDGYEIYPVGDYDYDVIPERIIGGIHLRFFVMIRQIWNNDRQALVDMFGSEENVRFYYGGTDRDAIIDCYRRQLDLACRFDVPYVVFHPVHYELDYVFNWQPPWNWRETIDLSAEIISEVVRQTSYKGWILFENLWWPGNFRLDSVREIERLLSGVSYSRCGLVLDTGHVFNKNQSLKTEAEAISFLLDEVDRLGEYRDLVRAVHLCRSLSGDYVRVSRTIANPFAGAATFWERFGVAARHVRHIDRHEAFEHPSIAALFDRIEPETVVFEFSFASREEWLGKIERQKRALGECFSRRRPEGRR